MSDYIKRKIDNAEKISSGEIQLKEGEYLSNSGHILKNKAAEGTSASAADDNRDIPTYTRDTTLTEDLVDTVTGVARILGDAFGFSSAEERYQESLFAERTAIAEAFLAKYQDSVENGTPLTHADVKDIQTLYFEGHLSGAADNPLKIAERGFQNVFDNPEQFGLQRGEGVSWSAYENGDRGYQFMPLNSTDVAKEVPKTELLNPGASTS